MHAGRLAVLTLVLLSAALAPAPAAARDFVIRPLEEPSATIEDSGLWISNVVTPNGDHQVAFARQIRTVSAFLWQIVVQSDTFEPIAAELVNSPWYRPTHISYAVTNTYFPSLFYQERNPNGSVGVLGQNLAALDTPPWTERDVVVDLGPHDAVHYPASVNSNFDRHVVYAATNSLGDGLADLFYARPDLGAYECRLLDDTIVVFPDRGRLFSIDENQFFDPRVAYIEDDNTIKYAWSDDGVNWTFETVFDQPQQSVAHIDLALDGAGLPHISFYLIDSQDLMYATRSFAGTWAVETAASHGRVGKWSSIAIDPAGIPHISCFRDSDDALLLVRPAPGDTWSTEIVDTDGSVGEYSSIGIDAYGGIHIAYYDATNKRGKQAWWLDWNVNGVHDLNEIASGVFADCNGNEIPDEAELLYGFVEDCNQNGIPDVCGEDCDGDGTADSCQIAAEPWRDCDGNGVLDTCDIAAEPWRDCDGNGTLDRCDISLDVALDCDGDGRLDSCQLLGGFGDCNANSILDVCESELVLEVPGTGFVFSPSRRAGEMLARGDLDGDDVPDLVLSEDDEIKVLLGGAPMDGDDDVSVPGNFESMAVGDVTGDGIDDLVVGDVGGWFTSNARVRVFRGDAGSILVEELTISFPNANTDFGTSLALADVDGDGSTDIIVGAPGADFGDPDRVFVFSSNPLDGTPDQVWTLDEPYRPGFGSSLANAGDLDGNGLDDVVVGCPDATGSYVAAFVYLSQADGPSVEGPVLTRSDTMPGFGTAFASAGDLNGDGFDDLLVGDPRSDWYGGSRGQVWVFHGGSPMDGTADLRFRPSISGTLMGQAIDTGSDLDGDGFDDILIGSTVGAGADRGVVEVYLGGPSFDPLPDFRFSGSESRSDVGVSARFLGDVDGDGNAEFAYGAPGQGSDGMVFVRSLALPEFGDCDGNGTRDACDIAGGAADSDGNGLLDVCEGVTSVDGDTAPKISRIVGAFPSPFNPRTTIVFELAAPSPIELTVYDAAGRRVDTLLKEHRTAGRHEIVWSAESGGRELASGVYYAVLRHRDAVSNQKLVLLK